MIILLLALIGLVTGLGLDALVVRLAVPPDDGDDDGEESIEETPAPALASVHAEAGSLVVQASPVQTLVRRTLIVGATAGLFAAAADRYTDVSHLAVVTAYVCVLIVCASTDALSYRVPNVVTYPAIVGALFVGLLMPGANILEVLAGGALAGGLLFLPSIFTGGVGMGMGDVKLATFVGLALGFVLAVPALVLMALAGGVAAVFLLVTRRRGRREAIPYAPFISIGALATMMWQGTAFISLL